MDSPTMSSTDSVCHKDSSEKVPQRPPSPPMNSLAVPYTSGLVIASIYPITLALATAFYLLSPSPASSESYFSQKKNIFNILFVKYAWFWTTVAFLGHVSRLRHSSLSKAALRWGIATFWWIAVTQWFFGPPIMDRAFMWSGGACETLDRVNSQETDLGMGKGKLLLTSVACKMAGGKWSGGHDLSGHVFLLTHASLFLWSEVLPALKVGRWQGKENGVVLAVVAIWWWMLLMTGIYFHTWKEKVSGLIAAIVPWGILTLPKVRVFLGVPGL